MSDQVVAITHEAPSVRGNAALVGDAELVSHPQSSIDDRLLALEWTSHTRLCGEQYVAYWIDAAC